jgi:hypothetical protein
MAVRPKERVIGILIVQFVIDKKLKGSKRAEKEIEMTDFLNNLTIAVEKTIIDNGFGFRKTPHEEQSNTRFYKVPNTGG